MALKEADIANFETLQRAFKDGSLALVECQDFKTGEYRAVLCAVNRPGDGAEVDLVPLGHMCVGNPYEEYTPPIANDATQVKH
jgi:hypothetical protein